MKSSSSTALAWRSKTLWPQLSFMKKRAQPTSEVISRLRPDSYEMDHPRKNQGRSRGMSVVDSEFCRSRGRVCFSSTRHGMVKDRKRGCVRRPQLWLGHNGEDVSFNSILKKYNLS